MEKRELKIIKNKDGHGTMGYKITLPSKWVKCMGLDSNKEDYAIVIFENNSIIIKNAEDYKMENIINELKEELLNKEFKLVDMDNTVERITGSTWSVFDCINDCLEQTSCAYYIKENKNIVVDFDIIENNEDETEIIVKVTSVWED